MSKVGSIVRPPCARPRLVLEQRESLAKVIELARASAGATPPSGTPTPSRNTSACSSPFFSAGSCVSHVRRAFCAADKRATLVIRFDGQTDPTHSTLRGKDAERLLRDLAKVCSPAEAKRRIAYARRELAKLARPKVRKPAARRARPAR